MLRPDFLFQTAGQVALLGWALLLLAPRWRVTRGLVLSGAMSLLLAGGYGALLAAHYLGPHGADGGFNSLGQVAALFQDPWALLAGWVHYLCFDLWVGAWETRDAHRRGVPHWALAPCLLATFMFGPLGWLLYGGVRRLFRPVPVPVPEPALA